MTTMSDINNNVIVNGTCYTDVNYQATYNI